MTYRQKEFAATVSFCEMIIPNANTVQQNFFFNTLVTNHQAPVLFVGPTGTGKSAVTNAWLLEIFKITEDIGYIPLLEYD